MPRKDAVWLNLQVSEEEKTRLTDYAHWCGKSRVDVLREFIQTLPVIEHMQLSEADSKVFLAALEKPPEPNEKLKQLMQTEAPWERKIVQGDPMWMANKLTDEESDNTKFESLITKEQIRPWLQSIAAEADKEVAVAMQLQYLADKVNQLETMIEELRDDRAFEEY